MKSKLTLNSIMLKGGNNPLCSLSTPVAHPKQSIL